VHVGLNLLHLVPAETGGLELYARRLAPALLDAGVELTLFASREGAPSLAAEPWAAATRVVEVPVNARSRPRRVLAEQTLLPAAVRRARVDLLHNMFTTAPVLPGAPQVTTIHDLIYKRVPETHAGVLTTGMAVLTRLAAHRSARVLTVSRSAAGDIAGYLGVDPDRIDVAYNGPGMDEPAEPLAAAEVRRRFELGDARLLLSVSAKRPHKNLERLIDAVAALPAGEDWALVVPGYPTAFEERLREHAAARGAGGRVRFLGWVDDVELDGLYRAADCFVFPSLAEGFGLPVLEAMRRGAPVASSDATSLPEVGGDAAVYFDPTDTAAMTDAILRVLRDPALAGDLRERGRRQAERFSWEECARRTLDCYRRALGSGAPPGASG
jgi:glycosyltransferase involved in cell wall biosynthesis